MTAEEYLFETLYDPQAYLVPGYTSVQMPLFQAPNPDADFYMPYADAQAIIAFLCALTETGESGCDLENLDALIAAQSN